MHLCYPKGVFSSIARFSLIPLPFWVSPQWFFALCYNRTARFRLIPLSIWIPFSLSFIFCLALRRFHSGCKCYSPTQMLPGTWSGFTPCYVLWQHPTYFQSLTPHPIPANLHTFSPWTLMGVISRFVSPYIKEEHINYPCFHCDPYRGEICPKSNIITISANYWHTLTKYIHLMLEF